MAYANDQATDAVALYVTVPDGATAKTIGRLLVERGLAACANLIPGMRSIYRWQGTIEQGDEIVLIAKTVRGRVEAAVAAIEAAHPFDTPAIVVLPIEGGSRRYLEWIAAETR